MKDALFSPETEFEWVSDYLAAQLRASNELSSLLGGLEDAVRRRVERVIVSGLHNTLTSNGLPCLQTSEHNKALAANPARLEDLVLWHLSAKCKSWPVEKEHGMSQRTNWSEIWKYTVQKRVEGLVQKGIELNADQVQTLRVLLDIEKGLN